MDRPACTVIGYGNVGAALSTSLKKAGYTVFSTYNRTEKNVVGLQTGLPEKIEDLGDLVFITVSDQAIREVAEYLSSLSSDLSTRCFLHCSGTLPSSELSPLQQKGAKTASFHPMMAIKPETDTFEGITFDGEGDEKAMRICRQVAADLNARFMEVQAKDRIYLHAASVVASNYLVTLTELAINVGSGSGRSSEELLQALLPLIRSTINNLEKGSTKEALTGPIARGEKELIKKHLQLLSPKSSEERLYRMLGKYTLGLLNEEETRKLEKLFSE